MPHDRSCTVPKCLATLLGPGVHFPGVFQHPGEGVRGVAAMFAGDEFGQSSHIRRKSGALPNGIPLACHLLREEILLLRRGIESFEIR